MHPPRAILDAASILHWPAWGALAVEVLDAGGVPEQNHLHAWNAAKCSPRDDSGLRIPVWGRSMGGEANTGV